MEGAIVGSVVFLPERDSDCPSENVSRWFMPLLLIT
jgi:hypothetical protein